MSETINIEMSGAVMHINVTEKQTLQSILDSQQIDPNNYILLVNGEPSTPEQEITEKDVIIIIPRVKGGALTT